MFQPGTTITIKPEYKKRYFRTYKVNHVTEDGHYDLTELDYKTLKPNLDENNYENNIIGNKDYIEREFQPLMEGGKRRRTRRSKTRRSKTRRRRSNRRK
jgi:hypothetical protein